MRKRNHQLQGLTLVEILVVVAIIAILAGLLFPVFARAKVKAIQTACSSNLRQTSVALSLYLEDSGGRYPTALNPAGKVTPAIGPITPYAGKSPTGILHCPLDRPEGRPSRRSEADRIEPLSYHFTWGLWGGKSGEEGWDRLLEVDPNPMVVRCYFHDDRMRQLMMADPTTDGAFYNGHSLVLRRDGSVKFITAADFAGPVRAPDGTIQGDRKRDYWMNASDVPCPPDVCDGKPIEG